MLEKITEIRSKLDFRRKYGLLNGDANNLYRNLTDLIEEEMNHRLALEHALRVFVEDSAHNPFHAAQTLKAFLLSEEREEEVSGS